MDASVQPQNMPGHRQRRNAVVSPLPDSVIQLSSSSDSDSDERRRPSRKRKKTNEVSVILSPLPPGTSSQCCKQFWKAGYYDGAPHAVSGPSTDGIDHIRVHPRFLHSNATSHKWALGAFAELLDNSLDEVCSGATCVNVDILVSKKDGTRMLLIEDNGGGMDPDKVRQCMALGYSLKSKLENKIGQYGNGFKTSTMRLGADVIVFSRCEKDGKSSTQSIGLLSYTFLKSTGKEDIIVPMLDYERRGGHEWNRMLQSSSDDWNKNVETIVQWSPFTGEVDLLCQFNLMKDHGTRIIIYNLWEDDQGQLELDFDVDPHDIQIRGVNRDEKSIQMAKEFPNSRHFLTYRHSLRSYASILYLRPPPGFRIILRGKDVVHHNIVNDMMMSREVTYRPQSGADGIAGDSNMVAVVTIGFVKDAVSHIDVSGFNVYHKNRLIKVRNWFSPLLRFLQSNIFRDNELYVDSTQTVWGNFDDYQPFWRIWNSRACRGRGVIGVLEADFVEPAHDKQGFERTIVLSRLETRLIQLQKSYWSSNCNNIGYVSDQNRKQNHFAERERSPDCVPESSQSKRKYSATSSKGTLLASNKMYLQSSQTQVGKESERYDEYMNGHKSASPKRIIRIRSSSEPSLLAEDVRDEINIVLPNKQAKGSSQKTCHPEKSFENENEFVQDTTSSGKNLRSTRGSKSKGQNINDGEHLSDSALFTLKQLKAENRGLKERIETKEKEILVELLQGLQCVRNRCKSLVTQLHDAEKKLKALYMEQETAIEVFSKERDQRDAEEKILRKKLQDASNTIQELFDKIKQLER